MKIYAISCSNERILQVRCATKEQEMSFFLNLLFHLGHLKCDNNNRIVCNVLFKKDDVLLRRVQSFCDAPSGGNGKLHEFYKFVQRVQVGRHFVLMPIKDECTLSEKNQTKVYVKLASLDTGKNDEHLALSFNDFKDEVSRYFDVIAVYDASSMKTYIGHMKQEDRECRFCGKSMRNGGVSFDKEAHAISELVSNRNIFLCDECDSCNGGAISQLEAKLATYLGPMRALLSVRGKKGYATHMEDNLSVVTSSPRHIDIKIAEGLVSKQEQDGVLKIEFDMAAGEIVPQDIYKLFAKYAVSVFPKEYFTRDEFKSLCDWIISNKYVDRLPLICTSIDGNMYNAPRIALYRRKNECKKAGVPKYLCELNVVATRYLYELPLVSDTICLDSVKKWQDFLQEIKFLGDGLNNSCMDFSGKEKVSCHNHIVLEGRSCSDDEQNLPESKS